MPDLCAADIPKSFWAHLFSSLRVTLTKKAINKSKVHKCVQP